jgi:hypothetical protein
VKIACSRGLRDSFFVDAMSLSYQRSILPDSEKRTAIKAEKNFLVLFALSSCILQTKLRREKANEKLCLSGRQQIPFYLQFNTSDGTWVSMQIFIN